MSGPASQAGEPITDRRQLLTYLLMGSKPQEQWRIGTEHEKFVFRAADFSPVPYEGSNGIRALLEGIGRKFDWQPVMEGENIIGLKKDGCSVSLEPGGQFELSGAPLETLHQTCCETNEHLKQTGALSRELGLGMIGMGFTPNWTRAQIPWMPKGRYKIMRDYMPKRGTLGLDMMLRTCTVQVNLDFDSEADMVKKFRVSLALQPIATALFAASPFTEGKPNGYQSWRRHIWSDTDPDRTGDLPFVFEKDFGFERYIEYVLDVPMYFVYRNGKYIDASGQSFRDFLDGKLPALPGEVPLVTDFADHLTTLFPEVRLKRFLEMRGADGGPWERICALPAFWTGLLYDKTTLDEAHDWIMRWSAEDRWALVRDVAKHGLKTPFRGGTVRDIAKEALRLSRQGLVARNRLNGMGENEAIFLNTLDRIVERNMSLSDEWLKLYAGEWNGDVRNIFAQFAYANAA
jgi:glutamate--cysteine ligase